MRKLSETAGAMLGAAWSRLAKPRQLGRTIFSFIVDADPKFAYQGYHLVRSLLEHSAEQASDIHVQFTPEVPQETRDIFSRVGCTLHQIERFGDGRYCNKVAQLSNLHAIGFDIAVLLDTDMIVLADVRPFLSRTKLVGKVVDLANPPLSTLEEIARRAGLKSLPNRVQVDASSDHTYAGNFNGGFYGVPKHLSMRVDTEWRNWATWLLASVEPLRKVNREAHVDQVAMWLAIHIGRIPFEHMASNANYYVHFTGPHHHFDQSTGIALLHYHDMSLDVVGKLSPPAELNDIEHAAVDKANAQIARGFESTTFWNLRYARFPDRGSGVGSRGENLVFKRELLIDQGIERAVSVLDVGCGDLEVLKSLNIADYLGIDTSLQAIQLASKARPDWTFLLVRDDADRRAIAARHTVLCFEVLIHQRSRDDYLKLVEFLTGCTQKTLIVSGYAGDYEGRAGNSMLYFYEPLEETLHKSGKFSSIRSIGSHSDVTVFRCDV
jgi:hypothetical protein